MLTAYQIERFEIVSCAMITAEFLKSNFIHCSFEKLGIQRSDFDTFKLN